MAVAHLEAKPMPDALFGYHAVLQNGAVIPVHGTADPNESIELEFNVMVIM
jgi:hypothetical protein